MKALTLLTIVKLMAVISAKNKHYLRRDKSIVIDIEEISSRQSNKGGYSRGNYNYDYNLEQENQWGEKNIETIESHRKLAEISSIFTLSAVSMSMSMSVLQAEVTPAPSTLPIPPLSSPTSISTSSSTSSPTSSPTPPVLTLQYNKVGEKSTPADDSMISLEEIPVINPELKGQASSQVTFSERSERGSEELGSSRKALVVVLMTCGGAFTLVSAAILVYHRVL